MKKLLLLLFGLVLIPISAQAKFQGVQWTLDDYSASAGATITINITSSSGLTVTNKRVAIYDILANSDLSSSVISIQKADTAGAGASAFTTVGTLDVGAQTTTFGLNQEGPIFIGDRGYEYRLLLNCTTANTLIVSGGLE